MSKRVLVVLMLCSILSIGNVFGQYKSQNVEIGKWREHLSYYRTYNVVKADEEILVACPSSLFYYNPKTGQSKTLSKVQGLSDAGINIVGFDSITKTAVIAYDNANIDILQNGIVYNIPDIKNRFIEGNKTINSIYFIDNKAFLACGFGVVVLDLKRHEIYDTWYVGENSSAIAVNSIISNDTAFFVGSAEGLLCAYKNYTTLASSQSWHRVLLGGEGATDNSSKREVKFVGKLGKDKLLISAYTGTSTNDMIFKYDGNTMDTLISSYYIPYIRTFDEGVIMGTWEGLNVYDTNFNQKFAISEANHPIKNSIVDYKDALLEKDNLWIAHKYQGLIYIPNYMYFADKDTIVPTDITFPIGPLTTDSYNMKFTSEGKLYVAPGGRTEILSNRYLEGHVYIYNGAYWWPVERESYLKQHPQVLRDVIDIAIDPNDEKHVMAASWYNGIWEIQNDTLINIFDSTNTNKYIYPFWGTYRVAGVEYDKSGNLLVASSLVDYCFSFLNYRGEWGGFNTTNFFTANDQIKGITEDKIRHYRLIYSINGKCIIVNNDSLSIRNIDPNNGSLLKTDRLNCMTQDLEGEIWIGTEKGIKVIYSLDNAFNGAGLTAPVECNNIVYTEGIEAQYLLSFENIQCIMVDGANRKWIGTGRNGVYLLSPNGDKEIMHFTAENSPLLSNKIICMAAHPITGEVFIGTDRGIISYRSDATPAAEEEEKLIAFPNPVREDYYGSIAIRGFVNDSDVRITDANGREVAHLKSMGGQAVWDGKNFNGQRVGSGVYYIFSYADNDGAVTKASGKILIIK